MRKRRYDDLFQDEDEVDPRSSLMNLFALQSRMTEFLTAEDATFVKNAGKPDMEIIIKKDNKVTRYKSEKAEGTGKGQRVGIAYRLESGEIIYVPEGEN